MSAENIKKSISLNLTYSAREELNKHKAQSGLSKSAVIELALQSLEYQKTILTWLWDISLPMPSAIEKSTRVRVNLRLTSRAADILRGLALVSGYSQSAVIERSLYIEAVSMEVCKAIQPKLSLEEFGFKLKVVNNQSKKLD